MKPVINDPAVAAQELLNKVFPGDAPSSPHSPANKAALEAAAQAEVDRVQAERHALEQAVRSGKLD